jgi:hypothetical protein
MERSQFKDAWSAGALYETYVGRWSRLVARELLEWLSIPELTKLSIRARQAPYQPTTGNHYDPGQVFAIDILSIAECVPKPRAEVDVATRRELRDWPYGARPRTAHTRAIKGIDPSLAIGRFERIRSRSASRRSSLSDMA